MRLYIAEKPSLGRAIADVLPKPHRRDEGCIWLGNGDCVSWCIGHLLELAEPDAYDTEYKRWQLAHLPIIPTQWQLQPKAQTKKQLSVLRKLVGEASEIVHAGDPDREGQLLVDQVINYLKASKSKKESVQRCLISDLNPAAVSRALGQLRSNKDFVPLSTSALARSRADWLYGINMTRAYTLRGRSVGYPGVLSVGRVQTPVLGLVVRRDDDIANFVSKPFYDVLALVQTRQGQQFKAKWQPSEACQPYMDEEGRVLVKALADNVVARITDKPAQVNGVNIASKSQAPPLPYNLSSLQIDAAKRFGMSAKQVLDTCQNLYERYKLITYPRSDSRYLPREHHAEGPAVIQTIAHNSLALAPFIAQARPALKSKAWNDSKVDAHHAIIPTRKRINTTSLGADAARVYELIARQYLCQFYPAYTYQETQVTLTIAGGEFIAKARQDQQQGWKLLFPSASAQESQTALPVLKRGEQLHCVQGELLEKNTQAPKHFTDATLLAAMTGIARFVKDPAIRTVLKETDGLGTEATRAGILELLFKRQFLSRKGKTIVATAAGRGLINSLPEITTTPDMTAQWETALNQISTGQANYQGFMTPLCESLQDLIAQSKVVVPDGLKGLEVKKPQYRKKSKKNKTRSKPRSMR